MDLREPAPSAALPARLAPRRRTWSVLRAGRSEVPPERQSAARQEAPAQNRGTLSSRINDPGLGTTSASRPACAAYQYDRRPPQVLMFPETLPSNGLEVYGAPERIRTSDPQIRSLVLYPAELRAPLCCRAVLDGRFSSCLVGVAGFEPATPTSRTWCATRLRYTPKPPRGATSGLIDGTFRGRKRIVAVRRFFSHDGSAEAGSEPSPRHAAPPVRRRSRKPARAEVRRVRAGLRAGFGEPNSRVAG